MSTLSIRAASRSARWGVQRALAVVFNWAFGALRHAALWALVVLYLEASERDAVLADPGARLRWVLMAGAVSAALKPLLDRPMPARWRGRGTWVSVRPRSADRPGGDSSAAG